MKKGWKLALVFQIVQKVSEKNCPCLYLFTDQVWWINELWFKRYIQKFKSCNMSVIRRKGESQNGRFKKTKHAKYSEKRTFLTP